jgi:hypothetical protein
MSSSISSRTYFFRGGARGKVEETEPTSFDDFGGLGGGINLLTDGDTGLLLIGFSIVFCSSDVLSAIFKSSWRDLEI